MPMPTFRLPFVTNDETINNEWSVTDGRSMKLRSTYRRQRNEELDDVGDEPRYVAAEEDADDDGGGARDADGARVGDAALALAAARHVAPQPRRALLAVAPQLAVDERVEDGEDAHRRHQVHQEVEEVDVHLCCVIHIC